MEFFLPLWQKMCCLLLIKYAHMATILNWQGHLLFSAMVLSSLMCPLLHHGYFSNPNDVIRLQVASTCLFSHLIALNPSLSLLESYHFKVDSPSSELGLALVNLRIKCI